MISLANFASFDGMKPIEPNRSANPPIEPNGSVNPPIEPSGSVNPPIEPNGSVNGAAKSKPNGKNLAEYTAEQFAADRFEAGMIGLNAAKRVALDSNHGPATIGAARLLMEFAGFLGIDKGRRGVLGKEPAAMSTEELKALIGSVDSELAARAKTVSAPVKPTLEEELFDIAR